MDIDLAFGIRGGDEIIPSRRRCALRPAGKKQRGNERRRYDVFHSYP
jgi:hypothetical protein